MGTNSHKRSYPGYVELDRTISQYTGDVLTETNRYGGTMSFSYDGLNRITYINMPRGNDVDVTWHDNYVLIEQGFHEIRKYWDNYGRGTGFTEKGGNITLYYRKTLDSEGRVLSEGKGHTDPDQKYHYIRNDAGTITKITDPRSQETIITLSSDGRSVKNPRGYSTSYQYDHLPGLHTSVTDPNGATSSISYDGLGRVKNVSFSGKSHSYTYDCLDHITSENHPETGQITYSFDGACNMSTKAHPSYSVTYEYNNSNLLTRENRPDQSISYSYNTHGLISAIIGSTFSYSEMTYNSLGSITKERVKIDGLSEKYIEYSYDDLNALSKIDYPSDRSVYYTNNGLSKVETLKIGSKTIIDDVDYGINGAFTYINVVANGTKINASYNDNGSLTSLIMEKGTTTLFGTTYVHDDNDNISAFNSTVPTANASFSYDNRDRLTTGNYSSQNKSFSYTYDTWGNLNTVQKNGSTLFSVSRDSNNRISSSGYSYNSSGNMKTSPDGKTYSWSGELLTTVTTNGNVVGSFKYDHRGLRTTATRPEKPQVTVLTPNGGEQFLVGETIPITWSTKGAVTSVSIYYSIDAGENWSVVAENVANSGQYSWTAPAQPSASYLIRVMSTTNGVSANRVRLSNLATDLTMYDTFYIYSSAGLLLAEYDYEGNCEREYLYANGRLIAEYHPKTQDYFYHLADQVNSNRIITDGSGSVVHSELFGPYGEKVKTWLKNNEIRRRYSGKERDNYSNLDYFGARYFSSANYTWISPDPVRNRDEALTNPQLWNLYAYCRNNPITFFDPDGNDYKRMIEQSWTSKLYCQWIDQAPIISFLKGDFSEGIDKLGTNLKAQLDDPSFWAGFMGGIHMHHSFPKFLGGNPKQALTFLESTQHVQLHKDLLSFLKSNYPDMVPSKSNTGEMIRRSFTSTDLQSAVADFYKSIGSKYTEASNDFFKQFPDQK